MWQVLFNGNSVYYLNMNVSFEREIAFILKIVLTLNFQMMEAIFDAIFGLIEYHGYSENIFRNIPFNYASTLNL